MGWGFSPPSPTQSFKLRHDNKMKWLEIIKTEFRRSVDFKGRTSPLPYFLFLGASVLAFSASLYLAKLIVAPESYWVVTAMITAVFYIPVTSAGVRRLHDVGETGTLMLEPIKPALAVAVILLILPALFAVSPVGTGIGILWLAITGIGQIALFALVAGGCIMTLIFFSNTMSTLMLPSERTENKYGPNPNEVTQ